MTNTTPADISVGTVSPDGLWTWNGTEWAPNPSFPGATLPTGKPRKKRRGLKIAGAVLIGLLAISAVSGMGDESTDSGAASQTTVSQSADAPTEEAPAEEAAAEEATAEEAAPVEEALGIGDAVQDGKFEFVIMDVEEGVAEVGDEYLSETAQGSYTLVTMTVENIGDEAQTFDSDNVTGLDSQGRELSADSMASMYASEDGDSFYEEINPGNSITVTVAFDVAEGETLDQVVVHDSMFSGGQTVTL